MFELIDLIKIIAMAQVVLILSLLLIAYGIKIYFYYKSRYYETARNVVDHYLTVNMKNSNAFNLKPILPYRKLSRVFIDSINKFDPNIHSEKWLQMRMQIMKTILLPRVAILSRSKQWSKRYIACQILLLSKEKGHKKLIKRLIDDPRPLVSINAAILAINYNSQILVDAVINSFSRGRRVQQSLYAQIISNADASFSPLVKNRLRHEPDPYIKAFCYRSLTSLPLITETIETVARDLKTTVLDLKLAVLSYLARNEGKLAAPIISSYLKDSNWEVRARAAKLIGEILDESFAHFLEGSLKDPEWWVRINAGESLAKLGKKGIEILKQQDQDVDQYAYDVARQMLSTRITD
jgi:hypothetical protein